jgi:hypothetical protein
VSIRGLLFQWASTIKIQQLWIFKVVDTVRYLLTGRKLRLVLVFIWSLSRPCLPLEESITVLLYSQATNTNFIVFGLTRPGLEPTICCTWGEHADHYTTDVVWSPLDSSYYTKGYFSQNDAFIQSVAGRHSLLSVKGLQLSGWQHVPSEGLKI